MINVSHEFSCFCLLSTFHFSHTYVCNFSDIKQWILLELSDYMWGKISGGLKYIEFYTITGLKIKKILKSPLGD